ncbi:hypothetical protein ABK040_016103 [Willaertia magna]
MSKSGRIVPVNDLYSIKSDKSQGSFSLSSCSKQNDKELSDNKLSIRKNPILRHLLSFRVFIISVINALVIITVLSIWLTSYLMNSNASVKTTNMIVELTLEKVSALIYFELQKAKTASHMMAQNYNSKSISEREIDQLRVYQFSLINLMPVSSMALAIGENGISNSHAIILSETPVFTLIWYEQENGGKLYSYNINSTTGYKLNLRDVVDYNVTLTYFYAESMNLFRTYPNGAFGSVYVDITGSVTLHYSSPIYNQTFLPQEQKLIGISKANILLVKISEFLSKIHVMTNGYLILTEYDTNNVIGASLQLPPRNNTDRIHTYQILDRNAGNLMKKIHKRGIDHTNGTSSISVEFDGIVYLVSIIPYNYENILWKLIVVLEQREVQEAVIKSTFIIVFVAIATIVLGVTCSFGIGFLIATPFRNLQLELKRMEILDLDQVENHSSFFTEIKDIYFSVNETVGYLKEFRSFIPETILEKVNNNERVQNEDGQSTITNSSSNEESFKSVLNVGLFSNNCTVLYVMFTDLDNNVIPDENELAKIISKVVVGVTTLCKTFKADCQTKNYDRFVIIFNHKEKHLSPIDLALKIKTNLTPTNSAQNHKINVQIGICTGKVLLGNVGNKQLRFPAAVGEAVRKAKDLAVLNFMSGTHILVDEKTINTYVQYLYLPVDRYKKENSKMIETVYEIVGRDEVVENDEWMYELEKKNSNQKIVEYSDKFLQLFSLEFEKTQLEELKLYFESLEHVMIDKRIIDRLIKIIDSCLQTNLNPSSYYSLIKQNISINFGEQHLQ